MPPLVPVTPCVDSRIAYDNSAKGIESIFNMFLVCVLASHGRFPLSPLKDIVLFTVAILVIHHSFRLSAIKENR